MELHLSEKLADERRRRGIRQEDLAAFMGVSKAAVSKWENGQSFPDITLLPVLAAYFNMSIDDLIGYEPDLSRDQIRHHYQRLADAFAARPFAEVMTACEDMVKTYYACLPFLLQMAVLLLNHAHLAPDPLSVYEKILSLTDRVLQNSRDAGELEEASNVQAISLLMAGKPAMVRDKIGERLRPQSQQSSLLGQAYIMLGQPEKAARVWQVDAYQHLLSLVGTSSVLISMAGEEPSLTEERIRRTLALIDLFQLDSLHFNVAAQFLMTAAVYFCQSGQETEALAMLERYIRCCTSQTFPIALHGDAYFPAVDGWLAEELSLGTLAPRADATVRESILETLTENPAFASLSGHPRFIALADRLTRHLRSDHT